MKVFQKWDAFLFYMTSPLLSVVRIPYAVIPYFAKIIHMDQSSLTPEFSICLKLTDEATKAINAIRQTLPPSPYRDDTPHLTLLRTIRAPLPMNDKELLDDMAQLLELSKKNAAYCDSP